MSDMHDFKTLEEEIAYWDSHSTAERWDELEDVEVQVDLITEHLYPKPIILASEWNQTKADWNHLTPIVTQFYMQVPDHLIAIKDVPAYQDPKTGQLYLLEPTFDKIESLLTLEEQNTLAPAEVIHVPVFSLELAT